MLFRSWLEGHVQAGTVTVLTSEMELEQLKKADVQEKISILKCPKFWRIKTNDTVNSTAISLKRWEKYVQYEEQWGYLYNDDCLYCNRKNECKEKCKHRNLCKLFVIKIDEEVVKIKRINKNAKLPVRGTAAAAGYDLAAARAAVVPAHGKVLVKTGLSMALPPGCYGRKPLRQHRVEFRSVEIGSRHQDQDFQFRSELKSRSIRAEEINE